MVIATCLCQTRKHQGADDPESLQLWCGVQFGVAAGMGRRGAIALASRLPVSRVKWFYRQPISDESHHRTRASPPATTSHPEDIEATALEVGCQTLLSFSTAISTCVLFRNPASLRATSHSMAEQQPALSAKPRAHSISQASESSQTAAEYACSM